MTESRRKNTLQYFFTDQGGSRAKFAKQPFCVRLK